MRTLIASVLLLTGAFYSQADLLTALQAYENKDYAKTSTEFKALIPLGNELAAFNLAAMAYNGEGQAVDLTQAQAYFLLAEQLGYGDTQDIREKIGAKLSADQQATAHTLQQQLAAQIVIKRENNTEFQESDRVQPIKLVEPKYPFAAARKGQFGYVNMRILIDEQGNVEAVDTLDTFPPNVFEHEAIKVLKRCKFAATGSKHLQRMQLDFSLGPIGKQPFDQFMAKHQIWQHAAAGSSEHQLVLGTMLKLAAIGSTNHFNFDKNLPPAGMELPEIFFKKAKALEVQIKDFKGSVQLQIGPDQKVSEVRSSSEIPQPEIAAKLLNQVLHSEIQAGEYYLTRRHIEDRNIRRYQTVLVPFLTVPATYDAQMWWERAAINGNLEAQRIMAAMYPQWESYLLTQQDAQVQAWAGARLILQGNATEGQQMLELAVSQNYGPAKQLKAAL